MPIHPALKFQRVLLTLAGLAISFQLATSAPAEEPEDLAGTWTWTWKDGESKVHKHVLDVEATGGKLSARERFDDEESIKVDDLKLKDDSVTFSVKRGTRSSTYKGKMVGKKTINGLVNVVLDGQPNEFQWTAERAIETKTKPK